MPLREIDLNIAQKTYFPHTQATDTGKKTLKTYKPTEEKIKQKRKKRLLITYDENVISPDKKCEDWLGLFDDQLEDEEELRRQKKLPKNQITIKEEKEQKLVKKQLLKSAILDKENVNHVSNINKTTKSFDKTPQLLSDKKSSLKRKLNWEVAEHQEESSKEEGVFIESGSDDNCNKKGIKDEYDEEFIPRSAKKSKSQIVITKVPKKIVSNAAKNVYKNVSDRQTVEQEEMDKKAYEEWREEYEQITNYPLIVEYADHDY